LEQRKNRKKALGLSGERDYVSRHGIDLSSNAPHIRPGARLGEAVGADETDTGNRYDRITGASLGVGMLEIELPWIERFGIELGIKLAEIKLTLNRAGLGSGPAGIEMLHQLSALPQIFGRGNCDGRWATPRQCRG
jgi:hypothetical protein